MPEIRFQIQWPDDSEETCYSPSLIVQKYFEVGKSYDLDDFVQRSQDSLTIASDRVKAKFGYPCGLAIGQREAIAAKAKTYQDLETAQVKVIRWIP